MLLRQSSWDSNILIYLPFLIVSSHANPSWTTFETMVRINWTLYTRSLYKVEGILKRKTKVTISLSRRCEWNYEYVVLFLLKEKSFQRNPLRVVNCGVGVVKKKLFGVGVTKKIFSESVSESHERKIYMNKYHKMKYMY